MFFDFGMKVRYDQYWDRVKFWKGIIEKAQSFEGTSPPALFVGSKNYPRLNIGVLSPPEVLKDAAVLDSPETWYRQRATIGDVLNYRSQMIYSRSSVYRPTETNRLVESLQEVAMSSKPIDIDVRLTKPPVFSFDFNAFASPIGNPAHVEAMKVIGNPSVPKRLDRLISDRDVKTADAIVELYRDIPVSSIERVLTAGLLGQKRKLVPTRWGITATDSTIGNHLAEKVKHYQHLQDVVLFRNEYLWNSVQILLIPGGWQFELIEIMDVDRVIPIVDSDYEPYEGRKTYASTTAGGFYAARLAVLEYLERVHRQASVITVREIKPEYNVPVGVWGLRENCRGAFDSVPVKLETAESGFAAISGVNVTGDIWTGHSAILDAFRNQIRMEAFAA